MDGCQVYKELEFAGRLVGMDRMVDDGLARSIPVAIAADHDGSVVGKWKTDGYQLASCGWVAGRVSGVLLLSPLRQNLWVTRRQDPYELARR